MREKEQLTSRAPYVTRSFKVSGGMAALSLGDIQGAAQVNRKFTKRLCQKEHRWFLRKYTKLCLRCGLEETR